MSLSEQLTRDLAFKENTDPRGIKWGIYPIKGCSLYEIHPVPEDKRTAIPEEVHGRWTNTTLAQKAIEQYLTRSWSENDAHVQKQQRKKAVEETANIS
jgi:hypothetical protein